MSNVAGKKLLVLGGGAAAYPVVKTAKEMELYVICVDSLENGVAKEISDEQFRISTADHETLLKLIKDKKVDGVFCGASEFNIQNMIQLTKMAGLPCYCNMEQWNQMQDKLRFKDTCREYGVPVVPEYTTEDDLADVAYPIIVKPVDSSSSRGLVLVKCAEDLPKSIEYAKKYSKRKEVIIERFMKCRELGAYYIIQNGVVSLADVNDRSSYCNRDGIPAITSALLYPSNYTNLFMEKIDAKIKNMIKGIGLKNGFMCFQIFVENDEFYVFECCLRVTGSYDYPILESVNGFNYMKMMIEYAVTGSMGEKNVVEYNDPLFHGMYAANLAIMLRDGQIGSIAGVDDILNHKKVVAMNAPYYKVGDIILPEYIGTLSQTFTRFHIVSDNLEELNETIRFVFKTIKILDNEGNNMLYSKFDYEFLDIWGNKGKHNVCI